MSRRTQDPTGTRSGFRLQGLHPLRPRFRSRSSILLFPFRGPSTPLLKTVWAPSLSLAATQEITVVFFSSGYLDVSVPRVALQQLWIHRWMAGFFSCRVPPFGHLRFFASLQLHGAFRSLARPSSLSSGKASSVRPSLLNQWFSCFLRDSSS